MENNPTYIENSNEIKEIFGIKGKALELNPEVREASERVPQIPTIELTTYEGNADETNIENTEILYPTTVSHHYILTQWNVNELTNYEQPSEYQVTIENQQTIGENEIDIDKLLPDELSEFKDVFQIPKGLPPDRKEWNFKLKITKEDLDKLPTAKPKEIGKEAEAATQEMLNQYLKDKWIEPANYDHAVNMFPVPKQDGTL